MAGLYHPASQGLSTWSPSRSSKTWSVLASWTTQSPRPHASLTSIQECKHSHGIAGEALSAVHDPQELENAEALAVAPIPSGILQRSQLPGRILDFNRIKDKERKASFGCESSLVCFRRTATEQRRQQRCCSRASVVRSCWRCGTRCLQKDDRVPSRTACMRASRLHTKPANRRLLRPAWWARSPRRRPEHENMKT